MFRPQIFMLQRPRPLKSNINRGNLRKKQNSFEREAEVEVKQGRALGSMKTGVKGAHW